MITKEMKVIEVLNLGEAYENVFSNMRRLFRRTDRNLRRGSQGTWDID